MFEVVKRGRGVVIGVVGVGGKMGGMWVEVVIHQKFDAPEEKQVGAAAKAPAVAPVVAPVAGGETKEEKGEELGNNETVTADKESDTLQEMGTPELSEGNAAPSASGPPKDFYLYFWMSSALLGLLLIWYYRQLHAEQFVILKLLIESVMPLGLLTILVLAVILFGICTATESAAVGAAGAFLLAIQSGSLNME